MYEGKAANGEIAKKLNPIEKLKETIESNFKEVTLKLDNGSLGPFWLEVELKGNKVLVEWDSRKSGYGLSSMPIKDDYRAFADEYYLSDTEALGRLRLLLEDGGHTEEQPYDDSEQAKV